MFYKLCAVYDIEAKIPQLYSKENNEFSEPLGRILESIDTQSEVVLQRLEPFFGSLITVTPYLTNPVARLNNGDRKSHLKKPTLLITDSTDKEAESIVVKFTDETGFDVSTVVGTSLGSGTVNTDFTSSDGYYKISTTDWSGIHYANDEFEFAYENYEATLRILTAYLVGDELLSGRYVSEAVNTLESLEQNYATKASGLFDNIITNGLITLKGARSGYGGPPISQQNWQGYDIDPYGFNQRTTIVE
jgi:hypothetical protein